MMEEIIRIFKPFFVYTALLLVFVLAGRHTSKHHPDIWKKFFPLFGYAVAAFNFFAAFLLIKGGAVGKLKMIDAMSHAFIPMLVGIVILTLLRKQFHERE